VCFEHDFYNNNNNNNNNNNKNLSGITRVTDGQTDRQTDGRTDGQNSPRYTASALHAAR